jgi:ubiquinone/menaquinone biosynthesis C-methylase UbiE
MSVQAEVYDDANATELAAFDTSHWWYRSKAALVATALRRTGLPRARRGWLIDIGGGSGGVTTMLGWPSDRVVLVEGNAALATGARRRHGLAAVLTSVRQVPFADGAAEVVCLLDVIEHFHDPVAALAEAARVLERDGRLVVNVPAHQWLWSAFDEQVGHVRRYTRQALRTELASVGFKPLLLSHIFSWLVPPMWLKRRALSGGAAEIGHDQSSLAIDAAARALTSAEGTLLGRASLPLGTSVLCVATRGG